MQKTHSFRWCVFIYNACLSDRCLGCKCKETQQHGESKSLLACSTSEYSKCFFWQQAPLSRSLLGFDLVQSKEVPLGWKASPFTWRFDCLLRHKESTIESLFRTQEVHPFSFQMLFIVISVISVKMVVALVVYFVNLFLYCTSSVSSNEENRKTHVF